jgi:hypothetical protein
MLPSKKIPSYIKLLYTAFLAILIPTYWVNYGPGNFLWISDVTLFLGFIAVVFENKLVASIGAVGGLILESFWTVCFSSDLFLNIHLCSIADYMFDPALPLWLRLLSLFHVVLPFLLIWLVLRLGYHRKAIFFQIPFSLILLMVCWLCTKPAANVNWVYTYLQINMNPFLYLFLEWLFIASLALITHSLMLRISLKSLMRQQRPS